MTRATAEEALQASNITDPHQAAVVRLTAALRARGENEAAKLVAQAAFGANPVSLFKVHDRGIQRGTFAWDIVFPFTSVRDDLPTMLDKARTAWARHA